MNQLKMQKPFIRMIQPQAIQPNLQVMACAVYENPTKTIGRAVYEHKEGSTKNAAISS